MATAVLEAMGPDLVGSAEAVRSTGPGEARLTHERVLVAAGQHSCERRRALDLSRYCDIYSTAAFRGKVFFVSDPNPCRNAWAALQRARSPRGPPVFFTGIRCRGFRELFSQRPLLIDRPTGDFGWRVLRLLRWDNLGFLLWPNEPKNS